MFPSSKKTLDTTYGFQTVGSFAASKKSNWLKNSSSYINQPVKQEERERVLSFIMDNHAKNSRIKLLSFPGERWIFEGMVAAARKSSTFIGIEADEKTFVSSRCSLIHKRGLKKPIIRHGEATIGCASIPYSNTTRKSKLLNIKSSAFCSILIDRYGATTEQLLAWQKEFCWNSAAWFDFTCQLCIESERTIKHSALVVANDKKVPVVYTVMNARDSYRGVAARVARIVELAGRDFEPVYNWTYQGMGGTPMLTVCGVMHGRRK